MARLGAWIGMVVAIPATVAFTPVPPPEPPPPWAPPEVARTQPVAAMTPTPAAPKPAAPASPKPATPAPAARATPAPAAGTAPAAPVSLPPGPASKPAPERDVGSIVVQAALTRVGAPYAWAAAGPDAFDCSGLVVWAFRQAGLTLPRSSNALASGGEPVPPDRMQPGDVISYFPDASHVGIYLGDGRMIHAVSEGVPVTIEPLHHAPVHNVRRYR